MPLCACVAREMRMTTELLGRLAADLLDTLASTDNPLTGRREHPFVSETDREAVLRFWQMQGVAGMVLRVYSPHSLCAALGQDGRDNLAASAAYSQRAAMALLAVLARVLALAADAGIAVAPFKGPSESQMLYGDFGVRATSDLDLLVSPRQRDALLDLLLENGWVLRGTYANLGPQARWWYRLAQHALVLTSPTGTALDLHWRINEYPLLDIDESRWLEDRSLPTRIAGQPAWQLEPVSRYLALLSHAARSQWSQLKWWTDLVRSRRLAVAAVGQDALAMQLRVAGVEALDAAWQESWAALRQGQSPHMSEPAYWLLSDAESMTPRQHFVQMWGLRRSLNYRLILCAHELIRWDDVKQWPLPDRLFPLYFLLRLPLWLLRRTGIIAS